MEEVSYPPAQARAHSLPVPNVQALAAAIKHEVPQRYIRPELQVEQVARREDEEIPIIDLSRLIDPQFSNTESARLHFACEEWGFFQLINHGVSEELMKQVKDDIAGFFKLPLEDKKAYAQLPNNHEGYGQGFVHSDDQKLDWADIIYINTRPIDIRNMRFWPTHPPTFRVTLDAYSTELKTVSSILLSSVANNLGLDPEILLNNFKDQPQGMRMNYFPPCPIAEKVLGISPHTDATGLTLLLQVSDVQGLQIRKGERWVPIEPLDGAFVVNIGDIIEIFSNGKYKSIEHRVTINPKKERLSIATFHNPNGDCVVGPLQELVKGGKAQYKTMSYEDYMKIFFSSKFHGRNFLETMKLE